MLCSACKLKGGNNIKEPLHAKKVLLLCTLIVAALLAVNRRTGNTMNVHIKQPTQAVMYFCSLWKNPRDLKGHIKNKKLKWFSRKAFQNFILKTKN